MSRKYSTPRMQDAGGVFFKCQARHCKKEFEIKINQDK